MHDHGKALYDAVEAGNILRVRYLLEKGANVDAPSGDGWTPLLEASTGAPDLVTILLEAGASPDIATPAGYTPLMRAAGHGRDGVVKLLLAAGADLDRVDDGGQTALDMAYAEGHPETARLLEEAVRSRNERRRVPPPAPVTTPPAAEPGGESAAPHSSPGREILVVPIFVSSTFRDMHAERDCLRDIVLPEVQERLTSRGILLELVDLRWGVDTAGETEIREKTRRVLRVCFAEIDRCKPYFISLVGDRHGWVPPPVLVEDAAREVGFVPDDATCSLTELEVQYFLDGTDDSARLFCYLRRPLQYRELVDRGLMSSDKAATYASELQPRPDALKLAERQDLLRQRLRTGRTGRVREYDARWNAETQSVDGLDRWKRLVVVDLCRAIRRDTRERLRRLPETWEDEEQAAIDEHVAHAVTLPATRESELSDLVRFATSPARADAAWACCVAGESGSGKTQLLAELCAALPKPDVSVLAHFTGLTARSTDVASMYERWLRALLALDAGASPLPASSSQSQTIEAFWKLLRRLSVDRRVLLVIDNAASFTQIGGPSLYESMSLTCPSNVRVVFSVGADDAAELHLRSGILSMTLSPLSRGAARAVATHVCQRHHRELSTALLEQLLARRAPDGREVAANPRWVNVATEHLNLLGREDYEEVERFSADAGEEQLERLLKATIAELPHTIDGLYELVLRRAERLEPRSLPTFAKLLALTREGISNADLQQLLARLGGTRPDAAEVAFLRRLLRGHIRLDRALGSVRFTHPGFATAVLRLYRVSPEERAELHARIADYLASLPEESPVRVRELMYHLIRSKQLLVAARQWAGTVERAKASGRMEPTRNASQTVRRELQALGSEGVPWLLSLLRQEELEPSQRELLFMLLHDTQILQLKDSMTLPERVLLYEGFLGLVRSRLVVGDTLQPERALMGVMLELGKAHLALGHTAQAMEFLAATRKEAQSTAVKMPSTTLDEARDAEAQALEHLARTLVVLGKTGEALNHYASAIALRQRITEEATMGRNANAMAVDFVDQGKLHHQERRFDESIQCFARAQETVRFAALDLTREERDLTHSLAREHEGITRAAMGDTAGATLAYEEVLRIRRRLLDRMPGAQEVYNLAVTHEHLGLLFERTGRAGDALKMLEEARRGYRSLLVSDASNRRWAIAAATVDGSIADVLLTLNMADRARQHRVSQSEVAERLFRSTPTLPEVVKLRLGNLTGMGDLEAACGNHQAAVASFRTALSLAAKLVELSPGSPSVRRDRAVIHAKASNALSALERGDEAVGEARKALSSFDEALADVPGDRQLHLDRAGTLWNVGHVYLSLERHDEAFQAFCLALDGFEALARSGTLSGANATVHARLREMLGR